MLHFINFFVKKYDIVLNSNMINKLKLIIHDIYWASKLPFLKKKYTFEFNEEEFNSDYSKKQKNVNEEAAKILSTFHTNSQEDNTNLLNDISHKNEILKFFNKNNVKTYKIVFNPTLQSNLYLYQGFIPKSKGVWSFILNIILLLNGNKVNLKFDNDDIVLYDDFTEYHVFIYKLYSYLQYKNQYQFVEEKKNVKFIKLLTKSNNKLLKNLSLKEIKILEKLILYEKEALGFSIGILRNNANIYEDLNQNDK